MVLFDKATEYANFLVEVGLEVEIVELGLPDLVEVVIQSLFRQSTLLGCFL